MVLTLNRPQQRNALNGDLLDAMRVELEEAIKNPTSIRAILIQSNGRDFSSGHDLKELQAMNEGEQTELFQLCSTVMRSLVQSPQPTICGVQGLATAAGCQLVASCDLVVGSPKSLYAAPGATTIGLGCHTPGVALTRRLGTTRAMDLLLTGRILTAQEALMFGLLSRIAGNPQKEGLKLAKEIASHSAPALQAAKAVLYQQEAAPNLEAAYEIANQAMVENLKTADAHNGIRAFLDKESVEWLHK